MWEFVECPQCAAKPGSPALCGSCITNRSTIWELNKVIKTSSLKTERSKEMTYAIISTVIGALIGAALAPVWWIGALVGGAIGFVGLWVALKTAL
jgi:hypothetical protein